MRQGSLLRRANSPAPPEVHQQQPAPLIEGLRHKVLAYLFSERMAAGLSMQPFFFHFDGFLRLMMWRVRSAVGFMSGHHEPLVTSQSIALAQAQDHCMLAHATSCAGSEVNGSVMALIYHKVRLGQLRFTRQCSNLACAYAFPC